MKNADEKMVVKLAKVMFESKYKGKYKWTGKDTPRQVFIDLVHSVLDTLEVADNQLRLKSVIKRKK